MKTRLTSRPFDQSSLGDLIDEIKTATEIAFYMREPLPPFLFKELKELTSREYHPMIDVVVEDFSDIKYLCSLYSAGFSVFYGLGLPSQSIVFLGRDRGFLLESHQLISRQNIKPLKKPQDLYFRLLWRRFGNAALLCGSVSGKDMKGGLFCLSTEVGREQWCRLRNYTTIDVPTIGTKVEVFAWEKWGSPVLEVLDVRLLEEELPGNMK